MADPTRPTRPAAPISSRVRQALDAKKSGLAAELLETHGDGLLLDGNAQDLIGWIGEVVALDKEATSRGRLALVHAWALVDAEQYGAASARLAVAERAARAASMTGAAERDVDLVRRVGSLRAHLAWVNGMGMSTGTGGASAGVTLHPDSDDHPVWRAAALLRYGRCQQLAGKPRLADDALAAAIAGASVSSRRLAKVVVGRALVVRGRALQEMGNLDEASKLYTQAADVANDTPDDAGLCDVADAARVGLAQLAAALGELASARTLLTNALTRASAAPQSVQALTVQLDGQILAQSLAVQAGDFAQARAAVDAAEHFVTSTGRRWALPLLSATRAHVALAAGDVGAAKRWAQKRRMVGAAAPSPTVVSELLLLGRLQHAGCDVTVSKSELDANIKAAKADGRAVDHGRLLATQVYVALATHAGAEAERLTEAALDAAGAARGLVAAELPDLTETATVAPVSPAPQLSSGFPAATSSGPATMKAAASPADSTAAVTSSDVSSKAAKGTAIKAKKGAGKTKKSSGKAKAGKAKTGKPKKAVSKAKASATDDTSPEERAGA